MCSMHIERHWDTTRMHGMLDDVSGAATGEKGGKLPPYGWTSKIM